MKVLYYCPEYYRRDGGRAHARGFLGALKELPAVSESFLYPKADPQTCEGNHAVNKVRRKKLWFLPKPARRFIHYFTPKRALTRALIREINTHACDALVIRTGVKFPSLAEIRKACPGTSICLEINAVYLDESFPRLPLKSIFQRWEVARFRRADAITVVSSPLKKYLVHRGDNTGKNSG